MIPDKLIVFLVVAIGVFLLRKGTGARTFDACSAGMLWPIVLMLVIAEWTEKADKEGVEAAKKVKS